MRIHSTPTLFERFFNEADAPAGLQAAPRSVRLALDLVETADEYEVIADVPGVTREDVEVEFSNGVLTIRGERSIPDDADGERHCRRRERSGGKFARAIAFRGEVDVAEIEASVKDGVLRVRIPKAEALKPRQIPVVVH